MGARAGVKVRKTYWVAGAYDPFIVEDGGAIAKAAMEIFALKKAGKQQRRPSGAHQYE